MVSTLRRERDRLGWRWVRGEFLGECRDGESISFGKAPSPRTFLNFVFVSLEDWDCCWGAAARRTLSIYDYEIWERVVLGMVGLATWYGRCARREVVGGR